MINLTVRYGGKKGKKLWKLEEAPSLIAVRTATRQPLARVKFRDPENRSVLTCERKITNRAAGVEVLDVGSVKFRNQLRKSMPVEPDIQFAGRVLRSAATGAPVLYTENLFVKFSDKTPENTCRALIEKHGLAVGRILPYANNAYFVKAPEGSGLTVFEKSDELFRENAVELCHPELVMEKIKKAANPNQWHLKGVTIGNHVINQHASVEDAWSLSVGRDVVIAVIDDGFDLGHIEFASPGKIVSPWDSTRDSDDPRPGAGDDHGTACAGVACADGVGNPGASGVAPGAKLMPIRNASMLGSVDEAEAFYHAADKGADIISCSWGPRDGRWWDPSDPLHNAVVPLPDSTRLALDYCIEQGRGGKGCVITWAAGNGNESADNDGYASYERVIAVAACNDQGVKSDYSDFGNSIWCAFPSNQGDGGLTPGIWTVDRRGPAGYNQGSAELGDENGNYTNDFGGTSSACPGAAGVAALVLSVHPDLTWDQVRQILKDTADKIDAANGNYDQKGHSTLYGYGRLNAKKAVDKAISMGGHPKGAPPPPPRHPGGKKPCRCGPRGSGGNVLLEYLAVQKLQAQNFAALLANPQRAARMLSKAGGAAGPLRAGRRDGGGGQGACRMTSQEVFEHVVEAYREDSNDNGPITRNTRFEQDLGFDSESIIDLAFNAISRIQESDGNCEVVGIFDGDIASQSSTFGNMADIIFENLS
jgi:subtilisin family serine protease